MEAKQHTILIPCLYLTEKLNQHAPVETGNSVLGDLLL